MRRRAASPDGFTLLEVLVSLAILSATLIRAYQVTAAAISAGGVRAVSGKTGETVESIPLSGLAVR